MPHVDEGRLAAWLDGALGPEEPVGAEVARHLEACADCRRRLEEARELRERTGEILAASDAPAAPAPGFDRLVARARDGSSAERPRATGRRRRRVPAAGIAWAASVALAVTAGWLARDVSLRRGETVPPFAGAPPVPAPVSSGKAAVEERPEPVTAEGRSRVEDAEVQEIRAAPAEAAALAAAPDPFHAPPAPGERRESGATAPSGCWEREGEAPRAGLPSRIRLSPPGLPRADGGARADVGAGAGTTPGTVTDDRGEGLARWTAFAADSVWIGGAGPETLRLAREGDRLVGLSRPRPGGDRAEARTADAGEGAAATPVVLRRVRCDP